MFRKSVIAVIAGGVLPGVAAADPQQGQAADTGGLEEVTVTAQRRAESLQTVPIAVSAFTAGQLEERQVLSTIDLVRLVPNLFGQNNTGVSSANTYFLRGLGSTEQIALLDPAVSTYVDDVIIPRQNANNYALFDIERLEVLRGPQGTTFGRNSTGGAISVITRKPGNELTGSVGVGGGSFGRKLARGTIDVPFSDKVLSKFSAYYLGDDGWLKNTLNGDKLNNSESWGARAALRFLINDNLTWDVAAEYTTADGVFARSSLESFKTTFSTMTTKGGTGDLVADMVNKRGWRNETDSTGLSSNFEYRFGEQTLNAITGYRRVKQDFVLDFGDPNPVVAGVRVPATAANYFAFALSNEADMEMFSQEFKFNGNLGENLKYVAGVYFFYEDNQTIAGQATGIGAGPLTLTCSPGLFGDGRTQCSPTARGYSSNRDMRNKTTSYAAYAQFDWKLGDRTTLIAGARFTDDTKKLDLVATPQGAMITADLVAAGVATKLTDSQVTPKAGVNFQLNDDVMLYASATRGFKSGGWNSRTAYRPQEFQPMKSEKTWSYEAGVKSEFLDRRLRVNANVYWAETQGLQLAYSTPGPIPGTTLSTQNNAGDIEAYGFELEMAARLNSFVDLYASLGLQEGKYTKVEPAAQSFCTNGGSLVNGGCVPRPPATTSSYLNAIDIGDTLSRFPGSNGNIGVNIRIPAAGLGGDFRVSVEAQYTGEFFVTASNAMPNLQLVPGGPFVSAPTVYPTLAASYTLLNAGLGYESADGNWRAQLECKNCADKDAIISVFNGLFFSEPRRVNVTLNYKF
jgi:iron complex outermembrane receptor protein